MREPSVKTVLSICATSGSPGQDRWPLILVNSALFIQVESVVLILGRLATNWSFLV